MSQNLLKKLKTTYIFDCSTMNHT